MTDPAPRRTRTASERLRTILGKRRVWLAAYLAVLALIAFWPTHVDEGAKPMLDWVTRVFPWLTYELMEFTANILLFVPLGALLARVSRHRWWMLAVAVAATTAIETAQTLLLPGRTGSVLDIVANTTGAGIGILLIVWWERRRARGVAPAR